jgi:hypothetical protein
VFDRFAQKDASTSRTYGGLGLGLAIAKQLVELHGGSIQARSAGEGKGATFIINLPLTLLDTGEEERIHPTRTSEGEDRLLPSLAGVHALVVDDEAESRDLVVRILEQQGAKVTAAGSGEQALRLLSELNPDVIVSDVGMPGMDGYDLMRKLRSQGRRIPAVALTAFARAEDRKRAILAGFQSHLAKPFDMAELIIVVAGLVSR